MHEKDDYNHDREPNHSNKMDGWIHIRHHKIDDNNHDHKLHNLNHELDSRDYDFKLDDFKHRNHFDD